MIAIDKRIRKSISEIPDMGDFTKVFLYVNSHNRDINSSFLIFLKSLTTLSDEIISGWLNINARTFRTYRKTETILKDNTKEHVVVLISLFTHGLEVFETKENFDKWLITKNNLLDSKAPMEFLDTISGIKFIDDRLTAIQYGDNV